MPLYQEIQSISNTKILIWKIEETLDFFKQDLVLQHKSEVRLEGMKSEVHQKGFLSIRKLLDLAGYTDFDLNYDATGKPHLKDGKHISISHSHHFSCIAISNEEIGIDLEMNRDKILKIANKFDTLELSEINSSSHDDFIKKTTVIWGVKEAIFKICNHKGISFKNHIFVDHFDIEKNIGKAMLNFNENKRFFQFEFEFMENFSLVVAVEIKK